MPSHLSLVTKKVKPAANTLPDWLAEAALLVRRLVDQGLWNEVMERLQVQRVGYVGIDVALLFICYFASDLRCGISSFCQRALRWNKTIAAVGNRRGLATQASVSRLLASVEKEKISQFGAWILASASGARNVLKHPASKVYDTFGHPWDFVDWDGTSTVLRQRALPRGADLPDGRRRTDNLAVPGYPGRKRGDVQMSRATLQHAGTGLWLDIECLPGRADTAAVLQPMLERLRQTYQDLDMAPSRTIIRGDGAAGNVPWISECHGQGFQYLTRMAHYTLLGQSDTQEHLAGATWYEVPDSGSGPQRQTADLGQVVLRANDVEVTTRVVVARHQAKEKHGAGIVVDGWQYELFATSLDAAAWPAPETVEAYFGRCGQENRFSQEDRELELDRTYSYHLPGQQLVTSLGLWVWNLRICEGFNLAPPAPVYPTQSPRVATSIELPVESPEQRRLPASIGRQPHDGVWSVRSGPRLPVVGGGFRGTPASGRVVGLGGRRGSALQRFEAKAIVVGQPRRWIRPHII